MIHSRKSLTSGQSFAVAVGGTALGAALSRSLAPTPEKGVTRIWYATLQKPSFQPPKKVFGPVWIALYACTAVGAWRLLKAAPSPNRSKAIGFWTAHLGLNAIWSKLFFGERLGKASLVDSATYLADSAALTFYASRVDRKAAILFAPLVGWLGLATLVNGAVVRKNPLLFRD